jgi:SLBB domain
MVAQPGPYTLDGPDESLLSVLGRAGGLKGLGNEDAADRVVLFPTNKHEPALERGNPMREVACADPGPGQARGLVHGRCRASNGFTASQSLALVGTAAGSNAGATVVPIIIDLDKPAMAACLDTPARPGDVIMVPAAGQVGVYGWVARPGSFNITPGMTVLGAITAAGGSMFSSNAEVMRTERGNRVSIPVNLTRVEHGSESDPAVEAGDIVLIKGSMVGAVPYAVYTLFEKFGTGLYLSPVGL